MRAPDAGLFIIGASQPIAACAIAARTPRPPQRSDTNTRPTPELPSSPRRRATQPPIDRLGGCVTNCSSRLTRAPLRARARAPLAGAGVREHRMWIPCLLLTQPDCARVPASAAPTCYTRIGEHAPAQVGVNERPASGDYIWPRSAEVPIEGSICGPQQAVGRSGRSAGLRNSHFSASLVWHVIGDRQPDD